MKYLHFTNDKTFLLLILRRFIFLITIFAILRIAFFAVNESFFEVKNYSHLLYAFVVGILFDLSLLTQTFVILLLLALLPLGEKFFKGKTFQRFTNGYFYIFAILLILPNIIDLEMYHFLKRRSNAEIFDNLADSYKVALPMLKVYWHWTLLAIFFSLTSIFLLKKIKHNYKRPRKIHPLQWFMERTIIFILIGLAFRGGYNEHPLRSSHAGKLNFEYSYGVISENSAHNILHSFTGNSTKIVKYVDMSQEELFWELKKDQTFHFKEKRFDNVVILIMESLGSELVSHPLNPAHRSMPFLQSLATTGLYYPLSYSSGETSRIAPYAIFASIPEVHLGCLLYHPKYSQTSVVGIGNLLKKYQYESAFFHNGKRGVFHIDTQAMNAGLEKRFTFEDYVGTPRHVTFWGIDDWSFAEFYVQKMNQMKQPFVTSFFTLSNHYPYEFPPPFNSPYSEGEEGKHRGGKFEDHVLKEFFALAQKQPWFENTLFIITGDHPPHQRDKIWEQHPLHERMVPTLIYHPKYNLKEFQRPQVVSHTDLLPTILDFLGVAELEKQNLSPFGRSIFVPRDESFAIFSSQSCCIHGVFGNNLYTYDHTLNQLSFKNLDEKVLPLNQSIYATPQPQHVETVKKYFQYYNNGVKENNLFPIK